MTEPSKEAMERALEIAHAAQRQWPDEFAKAIALAIDAAVAAEREACALAARSVEITPEIGRLNSPYSGFGVARGQIVEAILSRSDARCVEALDHD